MHDDRQHNALSALEVLFMAARAGIGFFARSDAAPAKRWRVTWRIASNPEKSLVVNANDADDAADAAMKEANRGTSSGPLWADITSVRPA